MSWDDEDADWGDDVQAKEEDTKKPNEDLWGDEDVSDEDGPIAGDDWDADPADKKAPDSAVPISKPKNTTKKKTAKQIAIEKEEQEEKARASRVTSRVKDLTLEQRRRAEEQADLALSADLFGEAPPPQADSAPANADNDDMAATDVPLPKFDQKAAIEDYELKKQQDYEKFAKEVAKKAIKANNPKCLLHFLKVMLTEASTKINPVDMSELTKHYNIIANKKAKELSNKKQAKGGNKKQLNMSKARGGGGDYDDYGGGGGGGGNKRGFDSNDYDFI